MALNITEAAQYSLLAELRRGAQDERVRFLIGYKVAGKPPQTFEGEMWWSDGIEPVQFARLVLAEIGVEGFDVIRVEIHRGGNPSAESDGTVIAGPGRLLAAQRHGIGRGSE